MRVTGSPSDVQTNIAAVAFIGHSSSRINYYTRNVYVQVRTNNNGSNNSNNNNSNNNNNNNNNSNNNNSNNNNNDFMCMYVFNVLTCMRVRVYACDVACA